VQSNNYYAFGMQTSESWTRTGTQPNKYLYNAGSEQNTATGNYEMFFREYDPALGRMNAVDPMASKYASLTPYNYAFNTPVTLNDPTGADPYYQDVPGYQHYPYWTGYVNGQYYVTDNLPQRNRGEAVYNDMSKVYGRVNSWQSSTFAGVPIPSGNASWQQILNGITQALMRKDKDGGSISLRNGQVSFFSEADAMLAGAVYKNHFGTLTPFEDLAVEIYFTSSYSMYACLDETNEAGIQKGVPSLWGIVKENPGIIRRILTRGVIPDALSWSINIDIVYAMGVDVSVQTNLKVLSGPDRGKSDVLVDIGLAIGYDLGVSILFTSYFFTGDIDRLSIQDFRGFRVAGSYGLSYFLEGGWGISIAPVNYGRDGYIIGITGHVGVSPPGFSGNINVGFTGKKK
jgi:RHS repeat-associated protein